MVCGAFSNVNTFPLSNYLRMKGLPGQTYLRGEVERTPEVNENKGGFEFEGVKYKIKSQGEMRTRGEPNNPHGQVEEGEELHALCKEDIPLLIARRYSLAYKDSCDNMGFHQGEKGDELYLFKEDKLAMIVFDSIYKA